MVAGNPEGKSDPLTTTVYDYMAEHKSDCELGGLHDDPYDDD